MDIPASFERPRIPHTSLKILHRLGKTLLRDKPKHAPLVVERSAEKLAVMLVEVHTAMVSRMREYSPRVVAAENEFDRAVDVNWITLRKLLECYRDAFSHPGLDMLPPGVQAKIDLPKLRHKAALADSLHERLFGADGTQWVSSGWVVQAETMAMILGLIESDNLGPQIASIVGPELLTVLDGVQDHYEDIVSARMSRDSTRGDDFRVLRTKLRWQIEHYRNAVETMREIDEPASFEIVDRALRSLVLLSKRVHGGTTSYAEDADDEELFEDENLEELEPPEADASAPEPTQALSRTSA